MSDYIPLDIMCPIPQGRNSDDMGMPSPVIKERVMTTQRQQNEELVKRLEHFCSLHKGITPESWAMNEAAAAITRLSEEVRKWEGLYRTQEALYIVVSKRADRHEAHEKLLETGNDQLRQQLNEALAANGVMREALESLMEYAGIIEERCDSVATDKARAALSTPSTTALAEHDAEIRRKALEDVVKLWDAPYKPGEGRFIERLVRMAAEKA